MTANELAKAQQAYSPPTLEEIINQQADRIAELEGEVSHLKHIGWALQRIAELEKTMGERLNDLNTRQVEDARTSLVSTPPYAYAVIEGEDGKENVSLQFDHPEMCGQKYKQSIPLFTTPQTKPLSDEEIDECKSKAMEQFYQLVTPQAIDQQMLIIDRLFARTIEERHGIK